MSQAGPFAGRTVQVVRDLSPDEQLYLYEQARRIKELTLSRRGAELAPFRITDPDAAFYLLFMEDSTRTKESFRNAAKFHGLRVNDFDAKTSSFQKKESITDTVKMLVGYAERSVFAVRTSLEGTCRWLEEAVGSYAERVGKPTPAFINGGDGRHEHPTQEFLDEFSFLEQLDWKRDHIHLALVGDLFHGRTVHSKVDGLRIFREVEVDLVAPRDMQMPLHYVERMEQSGYKVRRFETIEEYLASRSYAPLWYFTRLQLERMGDRLLDRVEHLRRAVTFRREFLESLGEGVRFYHPLPRHSEFPTIPPFLDATPLNGWDEQSMNGYYTRIALIGMVSGRIGGDFLGEPAVKPVYEDDFVQEVTPEGRKKPEYKVGIKPVESGIVIDHIGKGRSPREIWDQIEKIRRILDLQVISSHGVYRSQSDGNHKGLISLPEWNVFDERQMKILGAVAPGSTLNVVRKGEVERKFRMSMPPRIYNLPEAACSNEACISAPGYNEVPTAEFHQIGKERYSCRYCEKPHTFEEIWL
ncbi:MAG: aspartate carbamoyltransferase [Alkalispirochaetaceae bacterium]